MYHYVRNNEDNDYDTYCRRKSEFESQVKFFKNSSTIIHPADSDKFHYFLKSEDKNAFLLTFDDGYIDHLYCARYLNSENLSAYFFPPINSINGEFLDVNAIHILIGKRGLEVKTILEEIEKICLSHNFYLILNKKELNFQNYIEEFNLKNNHDDKNTLMLRRILQKDLIGEKNKKYTIKKLLKKFINKTANELTKDFYLSLSNLKEMKNMGMYFGSHGNTHRWLYTLNPSEQKIEIELSFESLKRFKLISEQEPKVLCYPFGAFDMNTLNIMNQLNIDIGLSSKLGSSILTNEKDSILKLSRWDTNSCWSNKWRKPCMPI